MSASEKDHVAAHGVEALCGHFYGGFAFNKRAEDAIAKAIATARAEGYREGLEAAAKELGVMAAAAVERAQEAESTGDFTLMNIRRTVAQGMREGAAAIRALAKEGR